MKKLTVILLALVMVLTAIPAMAEEPITIHVCVGWGEASLPNWQALADKYEAEHPGIKIELQWSSADMTKLKAGFMSGDAPEITQTWKFAFNEFVDAGLLTDLTDFFAEFFLAFSILAALYASFGHCLIDNATKINFWNILFD